MSTAALSYSGPITEATSSSEAKSSTKAKSSPKAATSHKGLFARFYDAMIEARMRQAMRELAMHRHLMPENSVAIDR